MKWLTKSDYLKFLIHPALLWMQKYDKDKLPPFDESGQYHVDQGNEVDVLARELFPDGVLVESVLKDAVTDTDFLVANGTTVLFQASVLTKRNLYARADVLVKDGRTWDIYEVKAASKVRTDHIHDLAFQKAAFTEYGYPIGRQFVVHINSQYVRQGDINPKRLFKKVEVTPQVEAITTPTWERVDAAIEVLKQKACPDLSPSKAGNLGAWLPVYRLLHPELEPDSIFNLKRVKQEQLAGWVEAGISRCHQIPLSSKMVREQRAYVEALRLGRPAIHQLKITTWLNKLQYPLYFLDYETYNTAIPIWDGQRPYAQLPFQYSLHILDHPGAELRQVEFLARGSDNPVPPLLKQLQTDLGPTGSVLVWFKLFESSRNDAMAALHPEFGSFLQGVNQRIEDLMEVFSNFWYTDPAFGGSSSIKNVLPVIVPSMSYKGLGIEHGGMAQVRWTRAARGELAPAECDKIYADLVEYCGQDTLAMVKIYEFLTSLAAKTPA
jgi:hypothetical protein